MPRENRKRGKRHKKQEQEDEPCPPRAEIAEQPSWIVSSSKPVDAHDPEAPFGQLEADVKAYFRTVDLQIRDWQENQDENAEEDDVQPNDKKRMFFMAALDEMRGEEKQLATDPECSIILERLLHSMDDFVLRVFVDSLVGSYEILIRHRFASHVCQTLFAVARDTIIRESKGVIPDHSISPEQGELRTLTELVMDICEEIIPDVASLVTHPFASHVIRSLLVLLSPDLAASSDTQSTVRSRKSAVWKARQGQMRSVFDEGKGKEKEGLAKGSRPEFQAMVRRIVESVRNELDENEVRAMAADKVACPTLKLLLEVEAEQDMSNESGSLMDRVTVGAITACLNKTSDDIPESDYVGTLIRDPNASHLLETVVSRCPADVFDVIWKTYLNGKLAKLAVHPVANFVLAKALERVSESQLSRAFEELDGVWKKLIQMVRMGVMRAVMDRVSALNLSGLQNIPEIVLSAFGFQKPGEDKKLLVQCILTMQSLSEYQKLVNDVSAVHEPRSTQERGRGGKSKERNPLELTIQGSLFLQSLLRLPESLNQFVVESILDISVEERIGIARHSAGSRVFDVFLDSATVPSKKKQQLVLGFVGHYHYLVDDRVGSRVVDRCWDFSDTYLKEKIARSLISKEQELAASFYGKFFAKNLNLYLLQRRPEEWRNLQSGRRQNTAQRAQSQSQNTTLSSGTTAVSPAQDRPKRKNRSEDDIIDVLFNERLGKKMKKLALAVDVPSSTPLSGKMQRDSKGNEDRELEEVLGAIRSAPKSSSLSKRNRAKKSVVPR